MSIRRYLLLCCCVAATLFKESHGIEGAVGNDSQDDDRVEATRRAQTLCGAGKGIFRIEAWCAFHAEGTTSRDENAMVNADNVSFNEYYFAGDHQVCLFTDRFSLRIQFDNYPRDISWVRWTKDTGKLPTVSYTEMLKAVASFYTDELKNATLLVDRCLPAAGTYEFTVFDFIRDIPMIPLFLYEISVDGIALAKGTTSKVTTFNTEYPYSPPSPTSFDSPSLPSPIPRRPPTATTPTIFSKPPPSSVCFSGSTTVEVKDRGPVKMRDLLLGDEVKVGRGRRMGGELNEKRYEPIYSFGHYDPQLIADLLEFKFVAPSFDGLQEGRPPLEISESHMLFNERMKAVAAKHYNVGDLLLLPDGRAAQILSIRRKSSLGVFAPFTPSGTIVVNGIVASTFIDVEWPMVSGQWVARSFEAPHRLICTRFPNWCKRETYAPSDNLSYWVHYASHMNDWVSEQHLILKVVAFVIVVATLLTWSAISSAWNYSVAAFVLVVAMAYVCKARVIAVRSGLNYFGPYSVDSRQRSVDLNSDFTTKCAMICLLNDNGRVGCSKTTSSSVAHDSDIKEGPRYCHKISMR